MRQPATTNGAPEPQPQPSFSAEPHHTLRRDAPFKLPKLETAEVLVGVIVIAVGGLMMGFNM